MTILLPFGASCVPVPFAVVILLGVELVVLFLEGGVCTTNTFNKIEHLEVIDLVNTMLASSVTSLFNPAVVGTWLGSVYSMSVCFCTSPSN